MCLLRVQVAVLVHQNFGEGELQFLVVAAVGDQGRQVQPAHPHVPVVLDGELPNTFRVSLPITEPFQKRMGQRGVPDHLALETF